MNPAPLFALEAVSFAYAGKPVLFDGLDLALQQGEHIGLYGPNGSGKTTLFRLIMGLEKPLSGRLMLHGEPVDNAKALYALRCRIGLIMQNADDQLFSPTVLDDVAFGPINLGLSRSAARERAMRALENMGMGGFAERITHRLSGGEKKLVSIASVLSMHPEALLLDEPTAFLDDDSRERMIDILRGLPSARIIISHDRDFLERTSSLFTRVEDGKLAALSTELPSVLRAYG
jgi:cobalt/nickel transport system ATP-binding protein